MQLAEQYDMAIVGGGLAGLACAIELRMAGYTVILFEKEKYPYHKVCGEYISMESFNYLHYLGVSVRDLNVPFIDTFLLTAPNGKTFKTKLPLGGFGISRYLLDYTLAEKANELGVVLLEESKVEQVIFNEGFTLYFNSRKTQINSISAKVCCAAWGKKSNIDSKWNRAYLKRNSKHLANYIGVKYHAQTNWESDMIGLHNFRDGYCGISNIENGLTSICYMTTSDNLKACHNNIQELQQNILMKNPHLKSIFETATYKESFPVTISQINFHSRTKVENHVIMIGDSAGMITPLCGNGMSIALHSAKMASRLIILYLEGKISRSELETLYCKEWADNFASRLKRGRQLQWFFGREWISNSFVGFFRLFPYLAKPVIRMTHGRPF